MPIDPLKERDHALHTLDAIYRRADKGVHQYTHGRHLGVTGITALRDVRTLARDALHRIREEGVA